MYIIIYEEYIYKGDYRIYSGENACAEAMRKCPIIKTYQSMCSSWDLYTKYNRWPLERLSKTRPKPQNDIHFYTAERTHIKHFKTILIVNVKRVHMKSYNELKSILSYTQY